MYRALFDIIDWIDLFDPAKLVWRDEVSRTATTYNLGSMEMVSDFEDEKLILHELGTGPEEVIDGDANYHSVKVNWYKYPLLPNGTWRDPEKTHKYCTFNAWEDDTRGFDLCNENEKISDPSVYGGITRYVAWRRIYQYQERIVNSPFAGPVRTKAWRDIGAEPVVVHAPPSHKTP